VKLRLRHTLFVALLGATILATVAWRLRAAGTARNPRAATPDPPAVTTKVPRNEDRDRRTASRVVAPLVERPRDSADEEEAPQAHDSSNHDPPSDFDTRFAAWRGEGTDSRWANSASRELRERIEAVLPAGASLDEVACRATGCFVALTVGESSGYTKLQQGLVWEEGAWPGAVAFAVLEPTPDGRLRANAHFSRYGED
jgi:hypothetical protein